MKKVIFASIMLLGISFGVNAQAQGNQQLKKHECTEACKTTGKHMYAHGEKGHVCTDACKKNEAALKDHVCTDACHKSGKHVYVHGEKGHVCTDACKKIKS
ncbi:MAG: hypothetical protein EPO58_15670 [Chitinophagaceae bacterium]|nr:hypothetical protein [Bacteroidota bacterium]TAJ47339.1 MAG: hypothetical protein EPO58_15670 [Chitinophagaceae bacterium]